MANISISDVSGVRTQSSLTKILVSQEFWVTLAVVIMAIFLVFNTDVFDTWRNLRNSMQNMAFIGIIALGQICVIITAGIDLSVGSVMAIGAVGTGLMMADGDGIEVAFLGGMALSMAVGLFNGCLVAFVKLPPFVVTLGTLSICRTIAMAATNNQLIYDFGPDEAELFNLGTGGIGSLFGHVPEPPKPDNAIPLYEKLLDTPIPFVVMIVLTVVLSYFLYMTRWGRHIFAVGGNEHAARLTGVPVAFIKISAYVFCSATAGLSGILMMGWAGSLNNSIGTGYELRVIAASVIGGANLMGGYASAFGGFIGSALLEILRNSLVLLRIDTNFHLGFVGLFIILAVLLERMRDSRISPAALVELFVRSKR
ncbi:MAG: ABC transporter permease [Alphaproteobacteria bacterium]